MNCLINSIFHGSFCQCQFVHGSEIGKTTAISFTGVRDTDLSRHHGDPIVDAEASLKPVEHHSNLVD